MGVQTIASVCDETQLIFHGATDSEEGSKDLSKTKISLKNIFYELRRLKSSARKPENFRALIPVTSPRVIELLDQHPSAWHPLVG